MEIKLQSFMERDQNTGKVQQRTLFTLYSKKEAQAAIGEGDPQNRNYFQRLLVEANPQLTFNWPELYEQIRLKIDILPDIYPLKEAHGGRSFSDSLSEFAR